MASVGSMEGFCSDHAKVVTTTHSGDVESSTGSDLAGAEHSNPDARSRRKHNMARPPKHMLNPFKCQTAAPPEPWQQVYQDLSRPLLVDVGCAKGRWVEELAEENPVRLQLRGQAFNYLGIELYAPLAEMARQRVNEAEKARPLQRRNLHFVGANIMTSLLSLEMPNLHTVCIQFPDPWIKKRKRRVVSAAFARQLGELLPEGGQVYLSSDYEDLATDMRAAFLASGLFRLSRTPTCDVIDLRTTAATDLRKDMDNPRVSTSLPATVTCLPSVVTWMGNQWCSRPDLSWLPERPFILGTERDQVCEVTWRPSYRCLFVREAALNK